jgi:hypothetical protein
MRELATRTTVGYWIHLAALLGPLAWMIGDSAVPERVR